MNETNDLLDLKQLFVFIWDVDSDFQIFEKVLDLVQLTTNLTAKTIYNKIFEIFRYFELDFSKIVSITVDGAPNLLEVKNGVATKINQYF